MCVKYLLLLLAVMIHFSINIYDIIEHFTQDMHVTTIYIMLTPTFWEFNSL